MKQNIIESIKFAGHGHWKVSVMYRGKEIRGITTNSTAIDRIRNTDLSDNLKGHYSYTDSQARKALRREVIINHLKQQK